MFDTIASLLEKKENFVIATIINRSGSAPRDVGTRMVIRKNGAIAGTIGGGILEAKVQRLAAKVLADRTSLVEKIALNTEDISRMGMICGGEVSVMIRYVDALDPSNLTLYKAVSNAQKNGGKAWLVTPVPLPDAPPYAPFLISENGVTFPETAEPWTDIIPRSIHPTIVEYNGAELLITPLNSKGVVYIFGAGHISQKLAPLTRMMDFYTVVLDDREEFANRRRFATADEVRVLNNIDSALNGLKINADSYLVIVTRGHSHDKTVLAQALRSSAGYIGMIGSRRKREDIYTALKAEGFTEKDLERVFSPIGLNIGAQTPEEIAVSIVAELILQRAGKRQ